MAPAPTVHDTGEGPALLFLHAFPLDASQWDHQVASLSQRYRCLRPDLWGFGASPPPAVEPSLDAYAAALLIDLEQRGVTAFSVIGLSLGGYVAFALLRAAAGRVAATVLANTHAAADSEAVRADRLRLADQVLAEDSVESLVEANVERLLGPMARAEPHVTDPLRGRIRRSTPAGVAWAARAMAARPESTAMLQALRLPALVITGSDDGVVSAERSRALAGALRGAELVTLDCGHLSNLEAPEPFTAQVERFLEHAWPG